VLAKTIGDTLRRAGLNPRALASWAGTDRLATIARSRGVLAARPITPASAVLALFVAGARVPRRSLRALDEVWPELAGRGWLDEAHDEVSARVAIAPIGPSLVLCEDDGWPDDSSYHLVGALPERRVGRWLDLGCGSGFAPLARPQLAGEIVGIELDDRAVRLAQAGCAVSGIDHVRVIHGDVAAAVATGSYDLITCNAPIPGDPSTSLWRHADPELFARLWATAAACARDGATVIVHGVADELVRELPGDRRVVIYTPEDPAAGVRGFGVLWWRPAAPANVVIVRRGLTDDRPHVDAADADPDSDVLSSSLLGHA